MRPKKVRNFATPVLVGTLMFAMACSKKDDLKEDPISARFGEFVEIPGFIEDEHLSDNFVASDEGLYATVEGDDETWIVRYNLDRSSIVKGTWEKVTYPAGSSVDFIETLTPINWNSEKVSEHHIFIGPTHINFNPATYRTISMASGTVVKQESAPTHDFNPANMQSKGTIWKDDEGQDWATFRGGTVSNSSTHLIKIRYGNLDFNTVATITADGHLYYSTSKTSSDLYALSYVEKKLFVIKPNGQTITKDLSPFYDPNLVAYDFKNKFRFSSHGVFFQFQDKVLKLINGENLTHFYTIKNVGGGVQLGDFCVDNDYLFATDGTRKELGGFQQEVNIIPNQPNTANPEILLEHITNTTFFKNGFLETSTDPTDKYIYVWGVNGKILILSKHYL